MASQTSEGGVQPVREIVHLNVGGTRLTTTLSTLRRVPGSKLYEMFAERGRLTPPRDSDGRFLIDRDGRSFHHLLNFLRDGYAPIGLTRAVRLDLMREAKFYGIDRLVELIGGPREPGEHAAAAVVACSAPLTGAIGGVAASGVFAAKALAHPPRSTSTLCMGLPPGGSRFGGSSFQQLLRDRQASARQADPSAADFLPDARATRLYVRLRYGHEYESGGWVVTSPRNLPGVEYKLHDACLARGPIAAMNKMCRSGYKPCEDPPRAPPVRDFHSDRWMIMMYTDCPHRVAEFERQSSLAAAAGRGAAAGATGSLSGPAWQPPGTWEAALPGTSAAGPLLGPQVHPSRGPGVAWQSPADDWVPNAATPRVAPSAPPLQPPPSMTRGSGGSIAL